MCYHAEFGCSRSLRVRISSYEPAKPGPLGPRRLRMDSMADRLKVVHPHMRYHALFGRSSLKSVGKDNAKPQKLGSAGADPIKQASSPYVSLYQIWHFCVKECTPKIGERLGPPLVWGHC